MKTWKKLLAALALLVAACMGAEVALVQQERSFPVFAPSGQQMLKGVPDDTVTITVTAAGDCTFGTDIQYQNAWSFDAQYERVGQDAAYFLEKVKPYFESDVLTIVNFEGTLSERGIRTEKAFSFRGRPEYADILTAASVEAANLANNHTNDYGAVALQDTKDILTDRGVLWFSDRDYAIKEIAGIKIGMIGTNALSGAGKTAFLRNLEELKTHQPDLIIASFHWGIEREYLPNATQMQLAHAAIDGGADLVIGHHPHVLQGIEQYKGKYIVYSLGNFCFGGNSNPTDKDSMLFRQSFRFRDGALLPDGDVAVVPCSVSSTAERNNYQPTPLCGAEFTRVKDKIVYISSVFEGIENIRFIEGSASEL